MTPMPKIYITTASKVKGATWAAKYPRKADEIYVVAQTGGKKKRVRIGPPTPDNTKKAERKVREWTYLIERKQLVESGIVAHTFAEMADEYLLHGLKSRARKTIDGRKLQVGQLKSRLGDLRMDFVGVETLEKWWYEFVEIGGRDIRTGKSYLNVVSMIFKQAAKTYPNLANPVPAARERILGEIGGTALFRQRNEANINPFTTDELVKLWPALEAFGNTDLQITMLTMVECGLRPGEACGLDWGDVWWGKDAGDLSRSLRIQRSRTNGRVGPTKTGESRTVAISQRLRAVLREQWVLRGQPESGWVVEQNWQSNIHSRLERVCNKARIARHRLKDARDTYASTLVTHGITPWWIARQMGHLTGLRMLEQHYGRYMRVGAEYQNPWICPPGSQPPDLFAELDGWTAGTTRALTGTTDAK
ncbi:MAG: site-specific integrase [Deltaproteobacteria bacterium]|nr:site-specific integrase [Deltaproteobacteria bacterium]